MGDRQSGGHGHEPVMVREVLEYLAPRPGATIVDATLGCAAHALHILDAVRPGGLVVGVDRDPQMIAIARGVLADHGRGRYEAVQANYSELADVLAGLGLEAVDGILLDLGASSVQLDDPARGFSYRADGPLSMQMSPGGPSAEDLVNGLPEKDLADVIYHYGEDRFARRIARRIVRERARDRITGTLQLARIIVRAVPRGRRRLHPARRTFQALRIRTNFELDHLAAALAAAPALLRGGGRLVVLSYHSLEDRLVKLALREGAGKGLYRVLTRKVVRPDEAEKARNRRSRSCKLRAAERVAGEERP